MITQDKFQKFDSRKKFSILAENLQSARKALFENNVTNALQNLQVVITYLDFFLQSHNKHTTAEIALV